MTSSAIGRTPVEIWSLIFKAVLCSPLLPCPEPSFAQSLAMFPDGCDLDTEEEQLNHLIQKLRLVCISWNEVVKRFAPSIVHCDLRGRDRDPVLRHVFRCTENVGGEYAKRLNRAVSGAQRLCAWESFYCECIPKCRSRGPNLTMCDLVMRPRKDEPTDPHFVPRSTLHQIEVFDAQNFNPGTNPVLLIDRMPNLRALRWIHPKNSSMLRSILEHPVNQRFVHLDIKLDVNQVRHLETSIHFTALETLHLEYHSVTPNKPEYGDTVLASWAVFPKLHQLVMDVTIGRNNVEEPISFLTKVGSKLSSLLLTMKVLDSTESEWFKPEMWDLFPSLVKFGPGYTTLTSGIPPPPQNMRPLTIMMKSPRDRLDFYEWQFSIPRLDSFVAACKAWRIEEVIVLDSWEQLRFSRKAWKYHCIKVYRELVENGIGIRDRDGLPIKDAREGI